jgi:hypothetical protein
MTYSGRMARTSGSRHMSAFLAFAIELDVGQLWSRG